MACITLFLQVGRYQARLSFLGAMRVLDRSWLDTARDLDDSSFEHLSGAIATELMLAFIAGEAEATPLHALQSQHLDMLMCCLQRPGAAAGRQTAASISASMDVGPTLHQFHVS